MGELEHREMFGIKYEFLFRKINRVISSARKYNNIDFISVGKRLNKPFSK